MASQSNAKRIHFFENLAHYLTGAVVLLKGIDKIGTPGKTGIAIVFLVIGLLIILGTVFHHKAEMLMKYFKAYVFAAEAIVISLVGYLYVKDGKHFIQYACFVTAIMFIVALVVYIRKVRNTRGAHSH